MILLLALNALGYTTYCQNELIVGVLPPGYVAIREADAKQYLENMKVAKQENENLVNKLEQRDYRIRFLIEDSTKNANELQSIRVYLEGWKKRNSIAELELCEKNYGIEKKSNRHCRERLEKIERKKHLKRISKPKIR